MPRKNERVVEGVVERGTKEVPQRIVDFIEQLVSSEAGGTVRVNRIHLNLETPNGPVDIGWAPNT